MSQTTDRHPRIRVPDTRNRLVEAAGQVFAANGFKRTTVREICRRAGANVAAVNYYFGDKVSLYAAVLRHAHEVATTAYPAILGAAQDAPARERLRGYIRSFLARLFDAGRPAWHSVLMAREMMEPTAVLTDLIRDSFRPRYEVLVGILREILGADAAEDQVYRTANSVLGQCLFYHHARHVLPHVVPNALLVSFNPELLAGHILTFSLGGMEAIALHGKDGAA